MSRDGVVFAAVSCRLFRGDEFLSRCWSLCLWHDRQGEKIPRKENPLSWDAADEDTAVAGGMELNTPISQMMGSLVV